MAEVVVQVEPSVRWDTNAPNAVLLSDDFARTVLALNPSPDDGDDRAVVFIWEGVRYASMGSPGLEALSGHRLFDRGLRELAGLGEVTESALITELDRIDRAHPFHEPEWYADMRHHILPLKQTTVDVVAATLSIVRIAGTTAQAAAGEAEREPGPLEVDDA